MFAFEMAVAVKQSFSAQQKNIQFRRTCQMNRHLEAALVLHHSQLIKQERIKLHLLSKTIENLRKEVKRRKYEETEIASLCPSEDAFSRTSTSLSMRRSLNHSSMADSTILKTTLRPLSAPARVHQQLRDKRPAYRKRSCYACSKASAKGALFRSRPLTCVDERIRNYPVKVRFEDSPAILHSWLNREKYLSKHMV